MTVLAGWAIGDAVKTCVPLLAASSPLLSRTCTDPFLSLAASVRLAALVLSPHE